MNPKVKKLLETLSNIQADEFSKSGKSEFFLFMEDVIGETTDLHERWGEVKDEE